MGGPKLKKALDRDRTAVIALGKKQPKVQPLLKAKDALSALIEAGEGRGTVPHPDWPALKFDARADWSASIQTAAGALSGERA